MQDEVSIQLANCNIYVSNDFGQLEFDYPKIIKSTAQQLLNVIDCPKAEKFELSMKLATNEDVQNLNRDYRGKNKPTNVLSFEEDLDDDFVNLQQDSGFTYVGDIIFAVPVLLKEAKEQNKIVEHHFAHLVVHSILHLFGFDHVEEKEAEIMESLEINILKRLEITNPYELKED